MAPIPEGQSSAHPLGGHHSSNWYLWPLPGHIFPMWEKNRKMVNFFFKFKTFRDSSGFETWGRSEKKNTWFWTKKLEMTKNQEGENIQWQLICGCSESVEGVNPAQGLKAGASKAGNTKFWWAGYVTSVSLSLLICSMMLTIISPGHFKWT